VMLNGEADSIQDPKYGFLPKTFVKKSTTAYESRLVGIVSTNPYGEILGDRTFSVEENRVPVALAGQVPVKVSIESGPIAPGDPITSSSTPGVGMKATRTGRIIGIALEAFPASPNDQIPSSNDQNDLETLDFDIGHSSQGEVMVFVDPSFYLPIHDAERISGLSDAPSFFDLLLSNTQAFFHEGLKQLGVVVEDGVAQVQKLIAREIRVERIEMVDQKTGDLYCTWIEEGEWQKTKGECVR